MTDTIRPIETSYRGCRFRRRLEARWAVFFDAARIEWQYEPEGFDLHGVRYLPDFWLPLDKSFLEIKPASFWQPGPYSSAIQQIAPTLTKLADASQYEVYLITGSPSPDSDDFDNHPKIIGFAPNEGICSARVFECQLCKRVSIRRFAGSAFDAVCPCQLGRVFEDTNYTPLEWSRGFKHAMQEARRARFERGENGTPRPFWSR